MRMKASLSAQEREAKAVKNYYEVVDTRESGGDVHILLRFKLPHVSNRTRKKLIEKVLEESRAHALIECFWTKGSIIYKNKWQFYAILVLSGNER